MAISALGKISVAIAVTAHTVKAKNRLTVTVIPAYSGSSKITKGNSSDSVQYNTFRFFSCCFIG